MWVCFQVSFPRKLVLREVLYTIPLLGSLIHIPYTFVSCGFPNLLDLDLFALCALFPSLRTSFLQNSQGTSLSGTEIIIRGWIKMQL